MLFLFKSKMALMNTPIDKSNPTPLEKYLKIIL
jgi:hypothetical protein